MHSRQSTFSECDSITMHLLTQSSGNCGKDANKIGCSTKDLNAKIAVALKSAVSSNPPVDSLVALGAYLYPESYTAPRPAVSPCMTPEPAGQKDAVQKQNAEAKTRKPRWIPEVPLDADPVRALIKSRKNIRQQITQKIKNLRRDENMREAFEKEVQQMLHQRAETRDAIKFVERPPVVHPPIDCQIRSARERRQELLEQRVMNCVSSLFVPHPPAGGDSLLHRRWSVLIAVAQIVEAIGGSVLRARFNWHVKLRSANVNKFQRLGETYALQLQRVKAVGRIEANMFPFSVMWRVRRKRCACQMVHRFLSIRRYMQHIKREVHRIRSQVIQCQRFSRGYLCRRERRIRRWSAIWRQIEEQIEDDFIGLETESLSEAQVREHLGKLHCQNVHAFILAVREHILELRNTSMQLRTVIGKSANAIGMPQPPTLRVIGMSDLMPIVSEERQKRFMKKCAEGESPDKPQTQSSDTQSREIVSRRHSLVSFVTPTGKSDMGRMSPSFSGVTDLALQ